MRLVEKRGSQSSRLIRPDLAPAKIKIPYAALPVVLPYASDGTYKDAMVSAEAMEYLVESMTRRMDNAASTEAIARGLQCRSMADLELFVAHGYLPDTPIPGTPVDTSDWPVGGRAEFQRLLAGRSVEDKEFFCFHGYWPGERENGNS
jgi:hypothetical protein